MIKVETIQNSNLTAKAMNLLDFSQITWNYFQKNDLVSRIEYINLCKQVLSIIWIVERFEDAPTDFEELRDVISYKSELNEALDSLLKKSFVLVERDEVIDDFIEENISYLSMAVAYLE